MTSWHLNIWKVKIWLPYDWKELSKWNGKYFSLCHKCSPLNLQNGIAKNSTVIYHCNGCVVRCEGRFIDGVVLWRRSCSIWEIFRWNYQKVQKMDEGIWRKGLRMNFQKTKGMHLPYGKSVWACVPEVDPYGVGGLVYGIYEMGPSSMLKCA